MRRDWNHVIGPQGSGQRFARALACISTASYVQSVIGLHRGLMLGSDVRLVADRAKVGADGIELEDHTRPGDYLTVGYRFDVDGEEGWAIDRSQNFEGEQSAEDFADALALAADRDFCESMVQIKAALDRFGGQVFIKSLSHEDRTVGLTYRYEHLVRGQVPEPDAEPEPEEPPAEAETPEEMAEELEVEREPVA